MEKILGELTLSYSNHHLTSPYFTAKVVDATKPGLYGEGDYTLWNRKVHLDHLSVVKSTLLRPKKTQAQFADLMTTTGNTFR